VKFDFICAIKYGKIIGYKLYEKDKGGIDNIKFTQFYNEILMLVLYLSHHHLKYNI
jgi:hypothetical protein